MIQPINIPWNEFPKSEAVSEGMIPLSPKCDKVTCEYLPDVVYQTRGETELHLQLLIPCEEFCPPEGVPLIVLIPGSAFHKQEVKRWLFQGMLLAVPITATVYKLLQRDVRRRQEVTVKENP